MDQKYTCMLFMGNGDKSLAACYDLTNQLMKAFELMGGLQQGPTDNKAWEEVHVIAENLYTALTGQLITDVVNSRNISKFYICRSPGHVVESEIMKQRR